MEKKDLEEVQKLARQLGYPIMVEDLFTRFQQIQLRADHALLVAEGEDRKVIGYIQINCEPLTLLTEPRADIAALIVDENFRGQKIGAALLAKAQEWARDKKFKNLRVKSNFKRVDAQRFYLREGFALAKNSNIFTKNLSKATSTGGSEK